MKTTTILLSIAFAFETIYSRAINDSKVDDPFEIVESENFVYKLHCSEGQQYCDGIKNDLDFAFNTLSNTFEIYQPISFEVFVDDITLKYGFGETLAAVIDTNFVPLKTSRSRSSIPYLYPQALTKQLHLNKQPTYKDIDFTMIINNCNSLPQFKDNEIRTVIIHEMLHGFGFGSAPSVKVLNDNKADNGQKGMIFYNENDQYGFETELIPSFSKDLMEITDPDEYINKVSNTKVSKFLPFHIFDKYLVSLKTGEELFKDIPSYYKEANKVCFPRGSSLVMKDITEQYLKNCIKKISPETQDITSRIIRDNYFDFHTLGIKTYDGELIPLQTMSGQYSSGSCVSHINNPLYDEYFTRVKLYGSESDQVNEMFDSVTGKFKIEYILKYYDENYISYFSDVDDFTVEEMLELLPNNQNHPLIGDGVVKILKTLGWNEKGETGNNKILYLDESLSIPETQGFKYLIKKVYEL